MNRFKLPLVVCCQAVRYHVHAMSVGSKAAAILKISGGTAVDAS